MHGFFVVKLDSSFTTKKPKTDTSQQDYNARSLFGMTQDT
ncbi:hypothetical protein PALB_16060 [Pseudoalteromonas luteoviolacea B = ATCC 29581]|nr:hypothetical protein PALB_16060 [Pseudoalteromonas luteoviolacea B = ATCC 29581]